MGERGKNETLISVPRAPDAGRRRTAPTAEHTSDVTRFRWVWLAAGLGAVVVVVSLVASTGAAALRSPGPLGRPHQLAKLECESCHKGDAPAASACTTCHGRHASRRPAHAAARKKGELTCASCHAIHRAEEGVAFLPGGDAVRFGTGWSATSATLTAYRPTKPTTVPLVPAAACVGCHDAASADDPIAACLIEGQQALGAQRPTVCFDEHRDITTIAGAGAKVAPGATTERDAAWEAARAEVQHRPRVGPTAAGFGGPLSWLGAGLLTAIAALVVGRTVQTRSQKRKTKTEPLVLQAAPVVRLPQIDATTCLGCYACVDACPYDVLEVRRYVAVVARADDCCGLTLCEQRCPNGSLVVREGDPIEDRPRVGESLESLDQPGVFLAGDLTGLPLIRNAINQGAHAARAAAKSLEKERARGRDPGLVDLAIVGAGPAGISAALEAKLQNLSALAIEQGSVAESIRSFPRGKLVFDQPLGMPIAGELWLEESTKEELLAKWLRIVRRERLEILERVRITAIEKEGGAFVLRGASEEGDKVVRARRVLLAIGRRGSPRKLAAPIAESAEASVFYSLADARSFAGQRVLVIGLGDTAMETAIALAHQPGTEVSVSYRGSGFRRGKSRNIDELGRLVERGRVRILFETEVGRIDRGQVELTGRGKTSRIGADAVFVMIGSIPPWSFLEKIGVGRAGHGGS